MQSRILWLVCAAVSICTGCNSNSNPAVTKSPAKDLHRRLYEMITSQEMLSLPFDCPRASDNGGLRVTRQIQIATPTYFELASLGEESRVYIDSLLDDPDESVRSCAVQLLAKIKVSNQLQQFDPQVQVELIIPLLERCLSSEHAHQRFWGASGLGDLSQWSDPCLERLKESLSKLQQLEADENAEVRGVAFIAYQWTHGALSTRAKDPAVRKSSREELAKLEGKSW